MRFWGVPSLVGFRYGRDHHAVVGAFVTHVPDNGAPQACSKSFESIAAPMVEAFEVSIKHDPPVAFPWNRQIVDVDVLFAKTATVLARDEYAASYATYPVWKNACLVVGVALPARGEPERAREVRDRFVKDVFPKVEVTAIPRRIAAAPPGITPAALLVRRGFGWVIVWVHTSGAS